ncbi:MAG: hypothetical protein SGI97_07190 [candidate division Zixibacteria bacterium]|nr:hypothetical protein [candidate division Zixibacteria bacterium]
MSSINSVRQFKETVELRSPLITRIRAHRYFPFALMAMAILGVACIHIWQRVMVIELAKEVGQLRNENKSLLDDTKKVNSDISALSMTGRIQSYATDSLGMQSVTADKLYTLIDNTQAEEQPDEFAVLVNSLKRVMDYLPVNAEAQAVSNDLRPIIFDTTAVKEQTK